MPHEIGKIEALFRYPIKSMKGEQLDFGDLGWHGLEGDRRFALRRNHERGAFPWLSASKLPDLFLFSPYRLGDGASEVLPTHVKTPDGRVLPILGEELAKEIEDRLGAPVGMMQAKHGVFDDASISVIATETVNEIGRLSATSPDARRFRPNLLLRLSQCSPFVEDDWVGGAISFGDEDNAPMIAVTLRDFRCSMVNLDPDTAQSDPKVMKAVSRANENFAGIYGTVTRTGRLEVGQTVYFHA